MGFWLHFSNQFATARTMQRESVNTKLDAALKPFKLVQILTALMFLCFGLSVAMAVFAFETRFPATKTTQRPLNTHIIIVSEYK